jgi:predicted metal-dependent phosphoesterase TrpH
MPRRQPFTRLCQLAASLGRGPAADLHVHTTASDGHLTPSQVVAHARQAGLAAVAVTDHDTLAGVADAVATANGFTSRSITVIPGVEITTEFDGREYHLLGYYFRPNDRALNDALASVRERRMTRFRRYLDLLAEQHVSLPDHQIDAVTAVSSSPGRRHLANLLVDAGHAPSRSVAFRRFLDPLRERVSVNHRLLLGEAVRLVAEAGGVAALAHPPYDLTESALARLGVAAVEVHFPAVNSTRRAELQAWADRLGLLVTGGSDYHGPDTGRRIGGSGLSFPDYHRLSEFAARTGSAVPAAGGGRLA